MKEIKKYNIKPKSGSALALSLILIMLLAVMCSTMLMVTTQNYITAAAYKDNIKGYYTGEAKVDDGVSEIRNLLTKFDELSQEYVSSLIQPPAQAFAFSFDKNCTITDDSGNSSNYQINFSFPSDNININNFIQQTSTKLANINSDKGNDGYRKELSDFVQSAYKRLYFLLVNEAFQNHSLICTFPQDATAITEKQINISDYINKYFLKDDAASTSLQTQYINNNNINNPVLVLNDGAYGISTNNLSNYSIDYSPQENSNINTMDLHSYPGANITWLNLNYKGSGNAGNSSAMSLKLMIKVPKNEFILSNEKTYSINSTSRGTAGSLAVSMSNAVTSYKNIIVKDGANVQINGDMYAAGTDLNNANDNEVKNINNLLGYDDSSKNECIIDSSQTGINTTDINAGGIRVGQAYPAAAGQSVPLPASLNVNGTIYTNDILHTLGHGTSINVNDYTSKDTTGYDIKKYCYIGSNNINFITGDPSLLDKYNYDDHNGFKSPFYPYSQDVNGNPLGGDVFCRKLITEEIGKKATINVKGRALIYGSLRADADDVDDDNDKSQRPSNSYSINIGREFYGLSDGINVGSTGVDEENHSCIIQNGKNATINIGGRVFVPSTMFLKDSGSGSLQDYQTAESISSSGSQSLSAYQDETDMLEDSDMNPYANYLRTVTGYTYRYEPYGIMPFVRIFNNGIDVRDSINGSNGANFNEFIDYFLAYYLSHDYDKYPDKKDRINSLENGDIGITINNSDSVNGMGYLLGAGIVRDTTDKKVKILAVKPEINSSNAADSWYNQKNSDLIEEPNKYDENRTYWESMRIPVINTVYTPKVQGYYTNDYSYSDSNGRGSESFDVGNNLTSYVNDPDKPAVDASNALLESSNDTTKRLIVCNSGVYVSSSNDVTNDNGNTFWKTQFSTSSPHGGIIVTNLDVVIKAGTKFRGSLITTGNVIYDNQIASVDSGVTDKNITMTYDENVYSQVANYEPIRKAILGPTSEERVSFNGSTTTSDVILKASYTVEAATSRLSRLEIIGWKKQ